MRKSLSLLATVFIMVQAQVLTRYSNFVFRNVSVTKNVVYGSNYEYGTNQPVDLLMDIYEPVGDTLSARPVIILIHAGSFLPSSIASAAFGRTPIGTREDSCIVELCKRYARMGYVAIAATHRVGWNPQATTQEARAQSIIQAVWRAVQDGRALVRYLRKNHAQWRIDTTRIVMGGASSGAYVGLHVAYLNRPEELDKPKFKLSNGTPFVDTTAQGLSRYGPNGQDGGNAFEGGSGNQGHTSNIQAIINLGGALGDSSFIQNEDIPVISLHGVSDPTTPYQTAVVYTAVGNYPIIEVSGSYTIHEKLLEKGNQTALLPTFSTDQPFAGLYPFNGAGFQPYGWYVNSNTTEKARALTYIDTIISFTAPRLFRALNLPTITYNGEVLSLSQVNIGANLLVYPSPATEPIVWIHAEGTPIESLSLLSLEGRDLAQCVLEKPAYSYRWSLPAQLPAGVYLLLVKAGGYTYTQRWLYQGL